MADNIAVTAGAGTTVSTEDVTTLNGGAVSSQHIQRVGVTMLTANGTAVDVNSTNPLLTSTVLTAGTAAFGKLAANAGVTIGAVEIAAAQTLGTVSTVTNLSQFGGAAINLGAGAVGTGTLRVTQASDSPEIAALGLPADSAWASGSGSQIALLKTLATAALSTAASSVNVLPATTGGLTSARVVTGTTGFIKASAGQLFSLTAYNSNAAVRYLHFYNKASAPTLSADTPIITIPLAATSVRDISFTDMGRVFSTGIAWAYTTDDVAIPTTAGTSAELHFSVGYA